MTTLREAARKLYQDSEGLTKAATIKIDGWSIYVNMAGDGYLTTVLSGYGPVREEARWVQCPVDERDIMYGILSLFYFIGYTPTHEQHSLMVSE